jgi:hypothetical protein
MIRQDAPVCAIGESPTKAYSFFPSSTLLGFSNPPLSASNLVGPARDYQKFGQTSEDGGDNELGEVPIRAKVKAFDAPSLMVFYRHVAQSVNHRGLGRADFDPFRAAELNGFVELFR